MISHRGCTTFRNTGKTTIFKIQRLYHPENRLLKYTASAQDQQNEIHCRVKSIEQKLLETVTVTVPFFLNFDEN